MIVIFEGIDNTGKTTIAKKLSKEFLVPYFKNSREHQRFENGGNFFNTVYIETDYCLDFLEQVNPNIIFDRHIVSEYVYAKTFNRDFNESKIWEMDKRLADLNTKLIYCYKPILYRKNFSMRNLTYNYACYLIKTKMKYLSVDTTDENLKTQLEFIKTFIGM